MRFSLQEFSGGLGDLGTFIPLTVSLVGIAGFDGGAVLLWTGLAHIATGAAFDQPIPVQPMKAIAAIAVTERLSRGELAAAGFLTGAVILLLGVGGLIGWIERHVPRAVVRGIQLGVGLKLAIKGLAMAAPLTWWQAIDSRSMAIAAALVILVTRKHARIPSAFILLSVGFLLSLSTSSSVVDLRWGWSSLTVTIPARAEWWHGLLRGALPQVPLTVLNSAIALSLLSEDLFPRRGVSARAMSISVGLINVCSCLFGAMPSCSGSGGLAAQYRFGARTGGSMIMLGVVEVTFALALGSVTHQLLQLFPTAILAAMLFFAGLELALPAAKCRTPDAFFVASGTAATVGAFNTGLGCLIGLVIAAVVRPADERDNRQPS